jgi:predicted DNA-binding transcriptional regulator AlpA
MNKIIRIGDASKILGVSRATVYRLVRSKALPAPIKITPNGRASGFLDFQLEQYIQEIRNKK